MGREGMVGNCWGKRVQVGFLQPSDVDLTCICWLQNWLWRTDENWSYGFVWTTVASESKDHARCKDAAWMSELKAERSRLMFRKLSMLRGVAWDREAPWWATLGYHLSPWSLQWTRDWNGRSQVRNPSFFPHHPYFLSNLGKSVWLADSAHFLKGNMFKWQTMLLSWPQAPEATYLVGAEGWWGTDLSSEFDTTV